MSAFSISNQRQETPTFALGTDLLSVRKGIVVTGTTNTGASKTITIRGLENSVSLTDYTLTLPVNDGNSGQVLQTDGSGGLSWGTATGAFTFVPSGTFNLITSLSFPPEAATGAVLTVGSGFNFLAGWSCGSGITTGSNNVMIGVVCNTAGSTTTEAIAIGNTNVAATNGVTIGSLSVSGANGVSIGVGAGSISAGTNGIAIGFDTNVGDNGVSIGNAANTSTHGGIALGQNATTTATAKMAIGSTQTIGGVPGATTASWRVRINGTEYFIPLTAA